MILKIGIATAAFATVAAVETSANAQERPSYFGERVEAPSQAIELSAGTGYTQGFGRIQRGTASVVGAGAVDDVASAGIGFEAGLGYRIAPRWGLGGLIQYQEFLTGTKAADAPMQMDSGSAARGMVAGLDVTYHMSPYQRLDPWVRIGSGYRFLWEVHNAPGSTYAYHGFDWGRLALGLDLRASEDVAIAPLVGVDINTFVWKIGAPSAAISDLGTSAFVYAGLQGRFDVAVSNSRYSKAVSQTQITQAELERKNAALAKSNEDLDRERDRNVYLGKIAHEYASDAALAERRSAMYKETLRRLQRQVDAGELNVTIRDNRMVLELPNDVLFASGHTELTPSGEEALAAVADALKPLAERHFQVAGHTDNVPIRSARFASNWELSSARAVRVVHFLIGKGVAPGTLSAAGYADVDPVAGNDTAQGRQHNRRTEITIQPSFEKENE